MPSQEAKIMSETIDNMAELGDRSVVEQGRGSLYVCIHEIAVMNVGIDSGDKMTQYLDAENQRIVIELNNE